jgi:hypothetical protein
LVSGVLFLCSFRKEKERDEKETKDMKTKSNSLLLTAALALGALAAYGQDRVVANIPFEFKTVAGVQPAGHYTVSVEGASARLRHVEGKVSLLGIGIPDDANPSRPPQLVFTCGSESGCVLTGVRFEDGRSWKYPAPRPKASENQSVAVIYLERAQAE